MNFKFDPIGIVHSCYKEKFGIPRQPGLVPAARAELELLPPYDNDAALNGLQEFSHVWIVFVFHAIRQKTWRPTVRPPRLGGNKRIGVFASRSNFRPNPIGLSAVRLEQIVRKKGKMILDISGADILDRTPVLDIKPYIGYADSVAGAACGFAAHPPEKNMTVEFSPDALTVCREKEAAGRRHLQQIIVQMLQNDPRPAYYGSRPAKDHFGIRLFDLNIQWTYRNGVITVTAIERI